jgi:putative Mg2+ transporter-C (MgtC) family protein
MGGQSNEVGEIAMDAEWLNLPPAAYMARVAWRLGVAAILGGLIGAQRELQGKDAGLRTHMTVSLAAAAFVLVGLETDPDSLGSVIQGIAAGVGFLGAGTILKKWDEGTRGLTTAATIWLTAAVGAVSGAGHGFMALVCVVAAWLILSMLSGLDRWLHPPDSHGTGN